MKRAVLIIVSLVIGFVIGYLFRNSHPEDQQEISKQAIEKKEKIQDIYIPLNIYNTEENNCEDLNFDRCSDFGPV